MSGNRHLIIYPVVKLQFGVDPNYYINITQLIQKTAQQNLLC